MSVFDQTRMKIRIFPKIGLCIVSDVKKSQENCWKAYYVFSVIQAGARFVLSCTVNRVNLKKDLNNQTMHP
jgi:hypothetical protein